MKTVEDREENHERHTVDAMINVIFLVTGRLFALEIVVWIHRLAYHLQAVQLMMHIQSAEVHPRAIGELHRGTVDSPQVISRDFDTGILGQLVPGLIQLGPWRSTEGIRVHDLVLKEQLYGLQC